MKYKYNVSVIIPCFNSSSTIKRCLDSITIDSLNKKEIILINDGSSDDTLKILKEYQKKYSYIKIINQKNMGQAVSRNNALKEASGEFICFVDSDDYVEKDYFKKMHECAKKYNSDYVYCDYYTCKKNSRSYISNKYTNEIDKVKIISNISPWAKLISKKMIDEINFSFINIGMYEDVAVIPMLTLSSKRPYYLEEALYNYSIDNYSIMRLNKYDDRVLDVFKAYKNLLSILRKNNAFNLYYDEIKYVIATNVLKCGVLKFSKYNQSLKYVDILRKEVRKNFDKLFFNKYYKYESFYSRILLFISIYFPKRMIYIISRIKRQIN